MKVTFLGGADEVGASCTLVEIAGKKLLIDAGIRISPKTSRGIQNDQLPDLQPISAIGGPDYLLVTHAHTDHTGALPLVMEQYPHIPVLMTRPTEALTRVLQKDAQNIMRSRHEQEGELPLFDEISVNRLLDAIQLVEFDTPVKLGEGLQVTYHVAGHIAGAAMLVLESTEGTLVMSGDVSLSPQRTVKSVQVPRIKADALVLESTYGGRLHANRGAEEKRLVATLRRVIEREGKVLIPAFALGRSQEIIQIIHAFRDELPVPVYVDGMVRTVCDAYSRFADLIPQNTVRHARDGNLFFRDNIKPIRSREHREEIARHTEPLIVVASSGMLTGGASVVYAKHFAADPRNAILLTGYQDEESPGRFLQRVQREKDRGDIPTLTLDGKKVAVNCEIDTYSLSAHADESELINVAQSLKAQEVMLVHGDEGARHSLASGLRQRQIITTTPRIGTERSFNFKSKPWAIGGVKEGSQVGEVDLVELWESLKDQEGNFFSARELAQVWWGDGARDQEMAARLNQQDNIYFAADWRNKTTFQVRKEKQIERSNRQREIMLRHPDIVGKLVVLRNSNNQPRLGVVRSADIDSFNAIVQNAKGSHYPGDALLWVIGGWSGLAGHDGGMKSQLTAVLKNARAHMDALMPFETRRDIVDAEVPVLPQLLLPEADEMPEGLDEQTALVSIVLALAKDGAVLEERGLVPRRARAHEPLEQNEARELAMNMFPEDSRLRKVGIDVHKKHLILYFDFPQAALRNYAENIEDLIEASAWDVRVKPQVNQQALSIALDEMLPEGARISKGPSFYMDKREVVTEIVGLDEENERELRQQFLHNTDFKLSITQRKQVSVADVTAVVAEDGEKLEINQAYALVRQELEPHGLYKVGLKQGQIVLSFISPQLGERFADQIGELAKMTGYTLSVHPHPNQQKIMEVARKIINAVGWSIAKGPSVYTDRGVVNVSLSTEVNTMLAETVSEEFQEQTGYLLEIEH